MTKTQAIAAARARIQSKMNPALAAVLAEVCILTDTLRAKRGTLVGISCENGLFAVEEVVTVGRSTTYRYLTGWQSHAECVEAMRQLAA